MLSVPWESRALGAWEVAPPFDLHSLLCSYSYLPLFPPTPHTGHMAKCLHCIGHQGLCRTSGWRARDCGGKGGLDLSSPGWEPPLEKEDLTPSLFKGASVSLYDMKRFTATVPSKDPADYQARNLTLLPSPTPASCDWEAVGCLFHCSALSFPSLSSPICLVPLKAGTESVGDRSSMWVEAGKSISSSLACISWTTFLGTAE